MSHLCGQDQNEFRDMKKSCKSFFCALCALLFLSGCGKMELYSNLPEKQANEMMSILQQHNIGAKKEAGAENTWKIIVSDGYNFSRAVELLNSRGYPMDAFENLGRVFQKSGLVSSPLEEKARFMSALAGDVSETINKIPGVLSARVHVVLPENDPYSDSVTPASAAVLITYRPESNLEEYVRDIKYIVTHSVEGLDYEKVSVAIFPISSSEVTSSSSEYANVMGIMMAPDSVDIFWSLIVIFGAITLCAAAAVVYFFLDAQKARRTSPQIVPQPVQTGTQQEQSTSQKTVNK